MSDVKQFEILGEIIKCKDEFARNEIAKLKIKNKNIVMIGDSYGEGYTPEGIVKSWIAYVQEYLPANYITSAIGGSGFVNGTTFLNQLVTITNKLSQTEKDSIDDIIVAGGYNDKGYSQDIITSAMSVFSNYA